MENTRIVPISRTLYLALEDALQPSERFMQMSEMGRGGLVLQTPFGGKRLVFVESPEVNSD